MCDLAAAAGDHFRVGKQNDHVGFPARFYQLIESHSQKCIRNSKGTLDLGSNTSIRTPFAEGKSEVLVPSVREFWLVALNIALGAGVLAPLVLVAGAAVRDALARRRHPDVQWVDVPGVGLLPVLRHDPHAS